MGGQVEDPEVVHHRDHAMVAPWAMCGVPMPAVPPRRGAQECPDCRAVMDSMWKEGMQQ